MNGAIADWPSFLKQCFEYYLPFLFPTFLPILISNPLPLQ